MYAPSPVAGEYSSQVSFNKCWANYDDFRILPGNHLAPGWKWQMWINVLSSFVGYLQDLDEFVEHLEQSCDPSVCDIMLKKADKKKDR